MGEQSNIMHKPTPPPCKRRPLMLKHPRIPYHPDMPPSCENYLSKKRLIERSLGLVGDLSHVSPRQPFNLKEVPNPVAEITHEEKMVSILHKVCMTENTIWAIINFPMPALNHVLCIYSIHHHKPSKHNRLHGAAACPYPL